MSLCLTLHINLGLSLRKTRQALKDLYNINISHQQIANYCKTAAICIKTFVDQYPYQKGEAFIADETYIKVRGIKTYVWLIMNAACRSIIGYQVSDNRGVGPCILAMRMAFRGLTKLPEHFKFIADGYSAYPLAAMEFAKKFGEDFTFRVTQVLGLTNDDAVSKEHRPDPIVQMGLFMDNQGIPITYELFPGNTNDCLTYRPNFGRNQKAV